MAASTGRIRNYFIAGVLTVIPVWITWTIFRFIVDQLSSAGTPSVVALSRIVRRYSPDTADTLLQPWFQSWLALILTLIALVLLGWVATLVVGRRLIGGFDALVKRIPLIEKIYGSSKAIVTAFQQQPSEVQRVVLVAFPNENMRTVGLVTRTLTDTDTGEQLAAVYVPTTPNPTSGYLEIVPVDQLIATDWTLDEAMTFVISGGAVAPDTIAFRRAAAPEKPTIRRSS